MTEPLSNNLPGLVIPERVITIPRTVSAEAQAFLARPAREAPDHPPASDKAAWRALADATGHGHATFWAAQGAKHLAEVAEIALSHVTLYEITPDGLLPEDASLALLYVHGGAFVFGGGEAAMHAARQIAGVARLKTYAVDYRMPPDHPFPAGLNDTVEAYRWLLQQYLPQNIAVYGISAGGNIAPAALLELGYQGTPLPAACAVHSPCSDLTESGDSYETNRTIDAVLQQRFPEALELYAGGHDPRDPLLSPAFARYDPSFPPTILTTGTRDLLLSSTVMLHRAMRRDGVEAELHVFEAMPHAPFFGAPEELELIEEQVRFLRRHLGRLRSTSTSRT